MLMVEEKATQSDFDAKAVIKRLPDRPGVYTMRDAAGEIIYVGKARRLRQRVASYFRGDAVAPKVMALVARVADIQVTVTHTEVEALLLESNLIKQHRPRYNVVLRDDKSYPYIYLADDHPFPRMKFYRGSRRRKGRLFGPYPNAAAVRGSLKEIQRLFLIRSCEDVVFANRSRPCLQYQIGRCSAPCVGEISATDYAKDLRDAVRFLEGKTDLVVDDLVERMDSAAQSLDFEQAAKYRDRIARLRKIRASQVVSGRAGEVDIIGTYRSGQGWAVAVGFVRRGRHLGHKTYLPQVPTDTSAEELRASFISQYYVSGELPAEVISDGPVDQGELIADMLTNRAGRQVRLKHRVRSERARWIEMAKDNAKQALELGNASLEHRLSAMQSMLNLSRVPRRIECFDISHTMGEATVASCVVFGPQGAIKGDYRRFNIRDAAGGDDYAAMKEALLRRYRRLIEEAASLPDLILIDGGKGQLAEAKSVLDELGLTNIDLIGVAKGAERKPGQERLFLPGRSAAVLLSGESDVLHLIQQIRDEAHRFAITGHRRRRAAARTKSSLETIAGLGPKRRRSLLRQFGGLKQVADAGVDELASVKGISRALAQRIYDNFHADNR
ncbi:MAG: excinuclease ABC subunit UvrC [Pseudomonadota bacterium]|nr:excinuclease ABC subunit UvrC [Pseudomonadota bacterium]